MDRRDILKTLGFATVGTALLPFGNLAKGATPDFGDKENGSLTSRRKLGKSLEVSSIGLGVQNMSRTYQTTIPNRKEMHKIIQKVFESGMTLFDTAEAYGPFECEKILGEATSSFRDKIVIETKYGWNID